ncbi:YhfG family protein [Marichromatium bheemlicum]|uniref:Uncharacterized protein n=1 Tax=Marichromatium bheemlicum TaxID=365339 RepID=A0ABX1I2X6_9GAMM|nr:YhfG family protein [Marichromatium bheemlicum]NKN31753.1 hypothetical protein [Marichromatium bheemlicum]
MPESIKETASRAISSKDIEALKCCGSYLEIKRSIELTLKNKIHTQGWESLFNRIQALKKALSSKHEKISNALKKRSLKESKNEIRLILGINVTARSKNEFSEKIEAFKFLFITPSTDPYQRYEETKKRNFKNSSRLEGIELSGATQHKSLSEIISKYKSGRHG